MAKKRVIKSLDDLKRKELIQIIRVYDNNNIIKGYHAMNKTQLKEAINKHIILSPDFKTIKPKQNETKLIEYDEFKKKLQKKDLSELELMKMLGALKGDKSKLEQNILDLKQQIEYEEDRDGKESQNKINILEEEIEDLKPQIKILKDRINKVIDLIKIVRERDEPKRKEEEMKENKKKQILKNIQNKAEKK